MSIGKFRFAWAWLIGAVLLAAPVRADVVDSSDFKIPQVTVDPTGACINGASYIQTTSSHLWVCGLAGWIDVTGTGTGGSTTALDNLASVNINSALLAQSGIDLGSTTKPFRNLYLYGAGTYSTTYLKLTGTPTSTRTITFPDTSATVATGVGGVKTLVSATPTAFVRVAVTSNGRQGGKVEYCVDANDATNYQTRCGDVPFAFVNEGGTESCTIGTPADADGTPTGTLTVAFTGASNAADTCDILANADSSLTETTLRINYTVRLFGNAFTAITPQ